MASLGGGWVDSQEKTSPRNQQKSPILSDSWEDDNFQLPLALDVLCLFFFVYFLGSHGIFVTIFPRPVGRMCLQTFSSIPQASNLRKSKLVGYVTVDI